MVHYTCCIVNCKNNWRNSNCKFYYFPKSRHKLDQRNKWITAVRRKNIDGSSWIPNANDTICNEHFVSYCKSNDPTSPSYVPTVFPEIYKKRKIDIVSVHKRYDRFMKRSKMSKKALEKYETVNEEQIENITDITKKNENISKELAYEAISYDKACSVYIPCNSTTTTINNTFVCNRYIYSSKCDAEIQTVITESKNPIIVSKRECNDKKCGTPSKTFANKSVDTSYFKSINSEQFIFRYSSIKSNEQLVDLAGVTFNNFKILLTRMEESSKWKVNKENRLFIFLVKLKTGLTYSALSVIFSLHRTTISKIFLSTLLHLTSVTADFVRWPDKLTVCNTMPDCFKPDFVNTRVIIDCTEFRIDVPTSVDNRVWCYSNYKRGFTAKVLIGITPSGYISFKSKVCGGRKTDSQITVESGILDLLENGDLVLADKGFPKIKERIDETGKRILLVIPPFLEKNKEFTKEETELTYNIARVRIHVERIMQRLRIHNILNKISEHLFSNIDDIVHMCCVLVNLQSPIISEKVNEK